MGNTNKRKSKSSNKTTNTNTNKTTNTNGPVDDKKSEKNDVVMLKIGKSESKKISLKLINQCYHSSNAEPIEEAIIHPDFKNSIIIACRKGDIKLVEDICSSNSQNGFSNIKTLYNDFNERIYSFILLKKNANKLCVGFLDKIVILELNNKKTFDLKINISCKDEGPIYSLLELENGNIVSAGKNIILWKKISPTEYTKTDSIIPVGSSRIINLVEFPFFKNIIATQENTHSVYLLKNEGDSISLLRKNEDVPSIWYKGSGQCCSKNCMLLVGKFELSVIDAANGEIGSSYPGVDRGTLLNLTQKYKENDFWIVSDFLGNYLEFYEQEGNDFIFYEKLEFNENEAIGWGNKLLRINDNTFVAIGHFGKMYIFTIKKLEAS